MITAAGAAAATGVRVFTATSSQGLLHAMEMIYTVAGWRVPLVLVNVSRGLASPITLEPDHNDILAARDSGWLQIHCATCQEVLDSVLIAYRLAEDPSVRLPVMVNLDGFYLSFTREPVAVPEAQAATAFVGAFDPGSIQFRASQPLSQARALLALGFSKGERIGVWATNNIEWLVLQMATARIGAILVNINPALRPRELAHALTRSRVQGLFTMPAFRASDYVGMLAGLMPELTRVDAGADLALAEFADLRRIVVYDPAAPDDTARPHPGFTTWPEFTAGADAVEPARLDEIGATLDADDAINIQYTSGTTGFPKAVVLSHHNILNNALFAAEAMHFEAGDRLCVPVPFYHCFGMVLANLLCLSVGACIVVPAPHFDALATLEALDGERCTALHGVPTMFISELEHPEFARFDLTHLRTGIMAGAPCPEALMRRVMGDMHCPEILIGYGQTEASPLTHLTTPEDTIARRTTTVGRDLPHQEVKIIDTETGRAVALGETGEICFRGYHVMRGYFADDAATAEALDASGWLHSGDLGDMDADGYVRITGRRKDMIIRGGENIYPKEIEDLLFSHPKIAQVAVFGVPDEFYGEEIAAWIQLHAGVSATEDEMRAFCKSNLAHFKTPRHFRFVDDFPMTVTGKLQKYRMREIAAEEFRAPAE